MIEETGGQGKFSTCSSAPPTRRIFTRENGQDNERKRAARLSLEQRERGERRGSGGGGQGLEAGVPTLVARSVITATVTQRQPLTSKRSRWRCLACRGKYARRGRVRGRLTLADVGVAQVPVGVLVEEGCALLALPPDGVVLAVVAHAAAHVARRHVHGQVEVARSGVLVALAP